MALESFSGIWSLVLSNPAETDDKNEGDDHLRGIKASIRQTFPNLSATINVTSTEINELSGIAANVQSQLNELSAVNAYGIMSLAASTTEFSASTSLSLFTGYDTVGLSNLVSLKTASGAISVTYAGHYEADTNLCISASTAANLTVALYLNDTDTGFRGTVLVPAQGRSNLRVAGIYSAGASDEFRVRLSASTAKLITVKDGHFRVKRLK